MTFCDDIDNTLLLSDGLVGLVISGTVAIVYPCCRLSFKGDLLIDHYNTAAFLR
jgi:hypothetical protein